MRNRVSSALSISSLALGVLLLAPATSGQSLARAATPGPCGESAEVLLPITFEGTVLRPDGRPARGALVVCSAGGEAVTGPRGEYRLEARVPLEACSVQVTAVGRGASGLVASTRAAVAASSGHTLVDPLELVAGNQCRSGWLPTFGRRPGVAGGRVLALAVFDDGSGPALYAGGEFDEAGGAQAERIAKWDGFAWTPLGAGIDDFFGEVRSLVAFDDGGGSALYVGGSFSSLDGVPANDVAKWNGSSWSALGTGVNGGGAANALAVFDDGGGDELYLAGRFAQVGGVPARNVAKWDGSSWSSLGGGVGDVLGQAHALAVFDDGGGDALFVGGDFATAGSGAADNVAQWDGSSWSALGSGVDDRVHALTVHDDGGGAALVVGGAFTLAGGAPANRIAAWQSSKWSTLGDGFGGSPSVVLSLAVHDDGGGEGLFAGGTFAFSGGTVLNRIARWDGASWQDVDGGLPRTSSAAGHAMTVGDIGEGQTLFVGGSFTTAGEIAADHVAQWDGSWSALGHGLTNGVLAQVVHDDGSGPALYAAGAFEAVAGVMANHIARWNGASWDELNGGLNGPVEAMVTYDDGSGPALFVCGVFTSAGGLATQNIAKWNGSSWEVFTPGIFGHGLALTVFDFGSGPELVLGGVFLTVGGVSAQRVARYDGSIWSPLGAGFNTEVRTLEVFDDGSGATLYAGGTFLSSGATTANRIARWDGASWTALGSGMNDSVNALVVYDGALHAGGNFTTAGGAPASALARWNGTSWADVGGGLSAGAARVRTLSVTDLGDGPVLHAGGGFLVAGGTTARNIARWDGTIWAALGSGVNGIVHSLAGFNGGSGPDLFVGGNFQTVLDSNDSYLGRWSCAPLQASRLRRASF